MGRARNKLRRQRRLLLRLERHPAQLRLAERKADTHAKIILGSLVVKADLAAGDSAVILGVLTNENTHGADRTAVAGLDPTVVSPGAIWARSGPAKRFLHRERSVERRAMDLENP